MNYSIDWDGPGERDREPMLIVSEVIAEGIKRAEAKRR